MDECVIIFLVNLILFWVSSMKNIILDILFWGYSQRQMVILVSEASNRYTHLFLVEREYFDFNALESAIVE
jgi:hypothetical protein